MIILSAHDLKKHGVTTSVSNITFMGKVFTRGQTIAQHLKKDAISLAHDIQRTGSACLLVDSGAYLTLWRESEASNSVIKPDRFNFRKLSDWSKLNVLISDAQLDETPQTKPVLKYRGRFVQPIDEAKVEDEWVELPSGLVEAASGQVSENLL
ncbi:MAG: hypothetical protein VKL39_11660 [Leptolyngbyaceae bacterium]|nr:hypothetical protein [Leptolyngbyaceae bacterium]